MIKCKISIITIAYNAENEIEETINSVLIQDYRPLEYVIVDGNSQDKTNDIIKSYISKLEDLGIFVKYISEPDKGISDAFNKGIKLASGDLIGLINAGDCLMPNVLNKIANEYEEEIDVIYGNTLCIDKKYNLKYLRVIPKEVDINRIKYDGLIFTHQSAFVRKKTYDRIGMYDVTYKYVMDSELFAKFAENNVKMKYLDEVLVSMLAGGISARPVLKLVKENIRIAQKYGGNSKKKIYFDWIMGLPRFYIVLLVKHFPSVWYKLIGDERRWKDEGDTN